MQQMTMSAQLIQCNQCGATWIGSPDDECTWCITRHERDLQRRKRDLLQPDWLADRELDAVRFRAFEASWGRQLHEAVDCDLITPTEYIGALKRWTHTRNSLDGTRLNVNPPLTH